MIKIHVKRSDSGNIIGFQVSGHAGFADYGNDIVCASVSVLVINCINSIEKYSPTTKIVTKEDEQAGLIDFSCEQPDEYAILLMNSLLLGLQGIQESYGTKYITFH